MRPVQGGYEIVGHNAFAAADVDEISTRLHALEHGGIEQPRSLRRQRRHVDDNVSLADQLRQFIGEAHIVDELGPSWPLLCVA